MEEAFLHNIKRINKLLNNNNNNNNNSSLACKSDDNHNKNRGSLVVSNVQEIKLFALMY